MYMFFNLLFTWFYLSIADSYSYFTPFLISTLKNQRIFSTKSVLKYDLNYCWYSFDFLPNYIKILIISKSLNFIYLSIHYLLEFNNTFYFYKTTFFSNFNFICLKTKNHPHQIIPNYVNTYISNTKFPSINIILNAIQKELSFLPFYYNIVLALSSLFLLFFIFLHKRESILSFSLTLVEIVDIFNPFFPILSYTYVPTNMFLLVSYYFAVIFYIVILVYNFYKFIFYLQLEIKCKYIYNNVVQTQYLFGISLFILSEIMLFFSFFWAFFHASLSPSIFIGNCWPPLGIVVLNPWHIPFLNTVILLTSGITINWFFFTLNRLSYINYYNFSANTKFGFSLQTIYYTTLNFWFVNVQSSDLYYDSFYNLEWFTYKKVLYYIRFIILYYMLLQYFFIHILQHILLLRISILLRPFRLNSYILFSNFELFNINLNYTAILSFLNKNILIFFDLQDFCMFWFMKAHKSYILAVAICSAIINVLYGDRRFFKTFLSILDNLYFFKLHLIRSMEEAYISLSITIYLGFLFLGFQYVEYKFYSTFDIDNIYGTVFYLLTSLHGFHVYLGLTSLLICYSYLTSLNFKKTEITKNYFNNFLFIFTVWYWHFVDIVWLFLFIFVYLWGG